MSSLYVIKGRDQGRRYILEEEIVQLGREANSSVRLKDTEISRRHAQIRRDGEIYFIDDQGSSNGTFVNGKRVTQHELQSGDRIQIGRTVMLFTRSELRPRKDPKQLVSIVESLGPEAESRIISTLGQEESSRLFAEPKPNESPWLARARSNLQVMYRTSLAVSHTLDIDELLKRILNLIFEWVEADSGCILLCDNESDRLVPKAIRGRNPKEDTSQLEISRTILEYVLKNEEGVLTSDAQDDQRWDEAVSILSMGIHEAICVPMQGRYGIVGLIYIDTHTSPDQVAAAVDRQTNSSKIDPNKFSEEHLKLMVAIGHQAALAVEDTSYYSAMLHSERLAAVGQTVSTLSHHIKNILQGIRGGSFLIEEGLKDEDFEVVGQGWKIVERNQERISNMVMDMLSFSKEREPEPELGDLNELMDDIIAIVATKAKDSGVEIDFQRDAHFPPVGFDSELLHRAVLNVVTNAVEACHNEESGRVTISIHADEGEERCVIRVEDSGEGIEDHDLETIFRAFESRKGSRGTGLGLPVSRKIMREHGGDIRVTSEVGKGSQFELWLPAPVHRQETIEDVNSQTRLGPPTAL